MKRDSVITIDLSTIRHNLKVIRKLAGSDAGVMPVVKANAYGHGSVKVAEALQNEVDWFAVNSVDEGIELRDHGIDLPILVFCVPNSETANLYTNFNLTATISELSHFGFLPAGTEYHLNFDTGMGRLGIQGDRVDEAVLEMEKHSALICTGIYSHFATSDVPGSEMVEAQLKRFKKIRIRFPDHLFTHIANTGGAVFYKNTTFDLIRPGIGIYGYSPAENVIQGLKPALSWSSKLVQVNPIRKGDSVSYGAHWEAPRDGFVGVIPVGYEDGLKRVLSGKIRIGIGGKEYRQVGNITMNYCMVFLDQDRHDAGTGVELLSSSKNDLSNWAELAGTIPYEILTSLLPKIPRVYE
ncbi:alanine racemase [Balneolaceae bacterium YR4-1]|uniref:Alanine racemase n=1 Tax=Halalkalibaculum roseum TaxID=2709311 RepID=A0A6M1SYG9_9BACT|nr:alanine racemase [Halalkalibaculum roseum]NGP76996.1 alanine racemase [Halalkalibaculum roseum]